MIPESLREKERLLRTAIERRQYDDLAVRLEEMRLIADRHRDPEVAGFMRTTIRWALLMVATQRQMRADQLGLLPLVSRYLDRSPNTPAGFCIDL